MRQSKLETADDRPRRVNWKAAIGLLVSGVSLFFAVRNLRPAEAIVALRRANYWWVAPAVMLYILALFVRTARWRVLLLSERAVPVVELLPTMAIGRGANNIYPFRTGEIVRVLLLRRRNGVSAAVGLASILVERIFDGLTMLLFLILAALIGGIPDFLAYLAYTAVAVFGLALAVLYSIVLRPAAAQNLADWLITHASPRRFRARLMNVARRFISGFSSVRSASALTAVLVLSLAIWTAETSSYRLLMNSFGFRLSLHHLLLMSGAANLGTALPSGPGNLGTFDAPAIEVLRRVGVASDTAFSYQLLLHAVLWFTETLAASLFIWGSGLGRAELRRTLGDRVDDAESDRL